MNLAEGFYLNALPSLSTCQIRLEGKRLKCVGHTESQAFHDNLHFIYEVSVVFDNGNTYCCTEVDV
jgi:hypothetical protein